MEMGCEWGLGLQREDRRECVPVLSGGELDGGRRVTVWVSPHMHLLILLHRFKYSIMHGCGT